jgi:dephospho-CoA kinase
MINFIYKGQIVIMNEKKDRIISVVGLCGSGKSVISEYIQNKGYEKVYFGGIVIDEVMKRGLPIIEENEKQVREELRKQYGMAAMAILSRGKIEDLLMNGKKVLIDGLYSMSEYKVLNETFPDMSTIAVFTPKKLRYERLSKRKTRPLSPEQAEKRDYAEVENIEKGGPIALADFTLVNDGTKEELQIKIEEILNKLTIK